MLKRLNGAVEFSKQRLKNSTLNQPRMQDTQDMQAHPACDSPKTTVAGIIAQKNINQGKPGNLSILTPCKRRRGRVAQEFKNKKERYREGGKVHPYCGKTCAEEDIGRKIGQPKQDAKLSANA